jgi:hypothetical protein
MRKLISQTIVSLGGSFEGLNKEFWIGMS